MLELSRGLTDRSLDAVADLERRVLAADGGRLKLEWPTLRSRAGVRVEDLLWWEGERLVGFMGLYGLGGGVEVAGMVDPAVRRSGIATALFDAAVPLCRQRGACSVLLVVPGGSAAGQAFARHRGGTLEHSEHAMRLDAAPTVGRSDPRLRMRAARRGDAAAVAGLLERGFGNHLADPAALPDPAVARTLLAELDGIPVATARLERDGAIGTVYGFVVDPAWRGNGIGRDMLGRVCALLFAEGAQAVALEVAVDNARALNLYTSVGFRATAIEDYYAVALTG